MFKQMTFFFCFICFTKHYVHNLKHFTFHSRQKIQYVGTYTILLYSNKLLIFNVPKKKIIEINRGRSFRT